MTTWHVFFLFFFSLLFFFLGGGGEKAGFNYHLPSKPCWHCAKWDLGVCPGGLDAPQPCILYLVLFVFIPLTMLFLCIHLSVISILYLGCVLVITFILILFFF